MIKYYFRKDKITYCEGPINEMPTGAIEVTKMPDWNYVYEIGRASCRERV